MRPLAELLADACDHARRAARPVEGAELSGFVADALCRDAVCFCLVVVAEACNEAAKRLPRVPAEIPWAQIKGMRNILVHECWQIDDEIVYNVARSEAVALAGHLDRLIGSLSSS
jgi:uncharacterized protein with HEPN domain